ncbi:RUN and FYVE domain-containing protein 2-like [Pollicipes pollicipes]|uniref:RUN and FYVE domain-containing protein 2-like n=1 Tax=Pollicipes pollicipes TaxID=41117 RepID=UPI001884CF03|nr:RUN and FYVE domain-containing protein 2-like [Pollicipes pollicipes]
MMTSSTPTDEPARLFPLTSPFGPAPRDRWPLMLVASTSMEISRKVARWELNKRDPVAIERSNLINISKLVVKELIESSVPFGRMLDSDHVPLQHFFIVLEHALRHGLRPKRGLLGPKKELWDVLQAVERLTSEAADITTSVRDLPTVKTPLGRARAWLRLALMQKKLPDYVRLLLEHQDVLDEHYEQGALMLSEEAIHVLGLLVGLNVIDCNLCMKEEELDCQQGVIDFSLYLRNSPTESSEPGLATADMSESKYERVLDQKNYIEELNRHLNATVTNLQQKLEQQIATCALLREDLAIARNQAQVGRPPAVSGSPAPSRTPDTLSVTSRASQQSGAGASSPSGCGEEIEDLRAQLREERAHRRELEKELEMQIQMKAEMEMATKLLEKDVHEKQDTIVNLRRQLDDIKAINLEMYNKLQECELDLSGKAELISRLQARSWEVGRLLSGLQQMSGAPRRPLRPSRSECQVALKENNVVVMTLEDKILTLTTTSRKMDEIHTETEQKRKAAEDTLRQLSDKLSECEIQLSKVSSDLKIEREWRESLQAGMVEDREKLATLQRTNDQLSRKLEDQETTDVEMERLRVRCQEHERTLEELGHHLSESKLRMEDLRQTARYAMDGQWVPDSAVQHCKSCQQEFTISRRKHHCRNCGGVFCHPCSDNTMALAASAKPVRVCDDCHTFLLQRYQAA